MTAIKNELTATAINSEAAATAVIDQDERMIKEAEAVYQLLNDCLESPGADIIITVQHCDGRRETAELYDHAVLVSELQSALKEFIDEFK